jgi:phosphopantetheinyl transferase (holo-ACP synthase)
VARIEAIESDDDMNTAGRSQSTAEFLQILACRWAGKPTLSKAVRTSRSAAVKKC